MPAQAPVAAIIAAMEGTMLQIQNIRARMKADFEYEFHNRPIEPWAMSTVSEWALVLLQMN